MDGAIPLKAYCTKPTFVNVCRALAWKHYFSTLLSGNSLFAAFHGLLDSNEIRAQHILNRESLGFSLLGSNIPEEHQHLPKALRGCARSHHACRPCEAAKYAQTLKKVTLVSLLSNSSLEF